MVTVQQTGSGFNLAFPRTDRRWDVYLNGKSPAYDGSGTHYIVEFVKIGELAIAEAEGMAVHDFGENTPCAIVKHKPDSQITGVPVRSTTVKAYLGVAE